MEAVDPQTRWELLKYEIRKFTISFSKAKARNFKATQKSLEEKIILIESNPNWEKVEHLTQEHTELKAELEKYYSHITEGLILRSKVNWYEYGEKSNKYFLTLERRKKSKTHIRKLKLDDNSEITNPKEILYRTKKPFMKICSPQRTIRRKRNVPNFCRKYLLNHSMRRIGASAKAT